ncbi:MAG TPA: hypothetical protein VGP41_01160 [Candidatus Lustribacter sp.]|nr:hypothetical protein [Candidatus Lustribacter sp.]
MKHPLAFALASALSIGVVARMAAADPMTPMTPGFHQQLKCNGGYVTVDVSEADPHMASHAALVTTAIAAGPALSRTKAVRDLDHRGDIFAIGYVVDGFLKRFPRRLLLPAVPPKAGEYSTYFNISGTVIEKHYEGTRPMHDAQGAPATGYVFSDYLTKQRLNTIVYVPAIGVAEARFFNLTGPGKDLICRAGR